MFIDGLARVIERTLRVRNAAIIVATESHRNDLTAETVGKGCPRCCFIYGVYSFDGSDGTIYRRIGISGTGFVVGKGLVATNRHIVRPWVDDDDSEMLIREGAQPPSRKVSGIFPRST